jgi:hypothetical protein
MGYFDVLTVGCFKTAQDERKLFFPWGILGRGYIIPSERDYLRLQQQIKICVGVGLVVVVGVASLGSFLVSFVVTALVIGFYTVWSLYLLRGLQRSDERLSFQESTRWHAHLAPWVLWLVEIGALVFVADGIFILIVNPRGWPIALLTIVIFGLLAAGVAHMIVLQRRAHGTSDRT